MYAVATLSYYKVLLIFNVVVLDNAIVESFKMYFTRGVPKVIEICIDFAECDIYRSVLALEYTPMLPRSPESACAGLSSLSPARSRLVGR